VEYFENYGGAQIDVDWMKTDGQPDTQAPEAPTALAAVVTGSTVDLSWSESVSADAVGYHVYRGTEAGVVAEGQPYSGTEPLSAAAFSDTNLTVGQTYYYVVTAVDAAGNESVVSNEATADVEAVLPPTDLVATGNPEGILLGWTASESEGVDGYHVYRATEAGVATDGEPLSGPTPLSVPVYLDNTAEADTTYYYVVTAVDADGTESAASNEAQGMYTVEEDTEAPEAATALTAEAGDSVVDLAWAASPSADVTGYRVYRTLDPGGIADGELVSGEALVTELAFSDTTVTNGTTYHYAVTAVDGAGNESAMTDTAYAVPRVPNDLDVKVDFGAEGQSPAEGYVLDYGQAFGERTGANQGGLTYGWTTADGNPFSLVGDGRDRGRAGIDERLDSIVHMQYGDVNDTHDVNPDGSWQLSVPDGLYEVTVAVGDEPGAGGVYDSEHVVNVEAGVGIESFVATSDEEYATATVTVGVWDGALTLSPEGGTNTKIAYVEVTGLEMAPHVDTVLPDNRDLNHDVTAGVSATIRIPYAGVGVDPDTLEGDTVRLYEVASGTEVPVQVGTSGGNDVISLSPDDPLEANTSYRFVVTSDVKDNNGAAFVPFTSVFTTGEGEIGGGGGDEFTALTNIAFEKVEQSIGAGMHWASFAFGPDGKLYGTTIGQGLFRFDVAEDGTLSNMENLGYQGRAMVGLVFDRDATADDLRLWITSTSASFNEHREWISGISLLTGPDLGTEHKVFEGLPRSQGDHLTNSITYGPDGRLYFLQGSNQAAGDLDGSWGQRGEKLLTAATLVFDQDHPQVQSALGGASAINVQTGDGGTY
ncbi:Ig-like domain-containing protein, partial [Georgenia sp. 10Sc9-8]|nr:Ig-like domain-containing protein [Georgenia halotolerans]